MSYFFIYNVNFLPTALQPTLNLVLLCIDVYPSHTIRHTVGLHWTTFQPIAEASTYRGQHNIQTQETNNHALSGIRTRDPSNQTAADLRLIPRGHWDLLILILASHLCLCFPCHIICLDFRTNKFYALIISFPHAMCPAQHIILGLNMSNGHLSAIK
jgi:hypothetical protein